MATVTVTTPIQSQPQLERGTETIIDTPYARLSKQDVYDYYNRPTIRSAINRAVGDREIVVRQSFEPGKNVLRRRASGELITNAQLPQLIEKRLTEVHPTFGKKVNLLLADIDPQPGVSWEKTKAIAETIAKTMQSHPDVKNVGVRFSGGRGFYVEGRLQKEMDVDEARQKTKEVLHGISLRPDTTFGIARPGQIRIDTTPLKYRGSIRAPYSLNAETGLVSAPVSLTKLPKVEKSDFTIQKVIEKAGELSKRAQSGTIRALEESIPGFLEKLVKKRTSDAATVYYGLEAQEERERQERMAQLAQRAQSAQRMQRAQIIPKLGSKLVRIDQQEGDIGNQGVLVRREGNLEQVERKPKSIRAIKQAAADRARAKAKEFAPGIPAARKTHPIPDTADKKWTLAIQQHNAFKAGPHWDFRLVDPETHHAHSFAVPKMRFPEKGETLLGLQQPTHKQRYALKFEGDIPRGVYGGGSVKMHLKEPVDILRSTDRSISLRRPGGDEYKLFRMMNNRWGIRKQT